MYLDQVIIINKHPVLKFIQQYIYNCARLETSSWFDILLQMVFSEIVVIQRSHDVYLFVLLIFSQKYTRVKTIKTNGHILEESLMETCFLLFPNLKEIIGSVRLNWKTVRCMQKMTTLTKICISTGNTNLNLNDDEYCRLFFKGLTSNALTKLYTLAHPAQLTFSKLESLIVPLRFPDHINFFSHFLHFYQKVHVEWIPCDPESMPVSIFESSLFYNIDMYPNHRLRHCELRFDDLSLYYVDEILLKWVNLESLTISANMTCNNINFQQANLRLETILRNCKKLAKLQLISLSTGIDKILTILYSNIEKFGHRLRNFAVVDMAQCISHRDLVRVINWCSNLESLQIIGSPTSRYAKEEKLKPLKNLTYFKTMLFCQPDALKSKVLAKFTTDVLKAAPNLRALVSNLDSCLIDELDKMKFSTNWEVWVPSVCICMDEPNLLRRLHKLLKKMYIRELAISKFVTKLEVALGVYEPSPDPAWVMSAMLNNSNLIVRNPDLSTDFQFIGGLERAV